MSENPRASSSSPARRQRCSADYDFPIDDRSHASAFDATSDDGPLSSRKQSTGLRGAPVEFDARRVKRIVTAVVVVGLALLVITLFAAGARQNSQISNLKNHGVAVDVKVVTCVGDLGGSGSNVSAYNCSGSFHLGGHTYEVTIPGSAFHSIGSTVQLVAATTDPRLVATQRTVHEEHESAGVFVLPTLILVIFLSWVTALTVRRRRRTLASL